MPVQGTVPLRLDVQAFTPQYQQGMGPMPVQNLPAPGQKPVAAPPAAPAPVQSTPKAEQLITPPAKDLSAPLGIGAVVLGGIALAIFG
ncbi:MAG TPA: hypothetical protein VN851_07065 [Thermoanaerobaculia bacterium]|nr:hypothetical protein [Thermoanaerobaculia bacterium]